MNTSVDFSHDPSKLVSRLGRAKKVKLKPPFAVSVCL